MTRAVGLAALLVACGASALPPPGVPLTVTQSGAIPAPAAPPQVDAPRFPRPVEHVAASGARLWLRTASHDELTVQLVTRRGDDGAHPHGILDFAIDRLRKPIRARYPAAAPYGGANLHGAYLSVRVAPDQLQPMLAFLRDTLRRPSWQARDVERARSRLRNGLEALENAVEAGALLAAAEHLEGGPGRLGHGHEPWLERVGAYTNEAMAAALEERFDPSELMVAVTGPIEADDAIAAFGSVFEAAPTTERRAAPERRAARPERALLSQVTQAERAHVLMAQEALPPQHPERPAFDLLTELLGGTFTSLLNGSLREQHAYTYGAFAGVSASYYRDVLWVRADFEPQRVYGALQVLFAQLRQMRREPLSEEQLALGRARVWSHMRWRIEHAPSSVLRDLWWSELTAETMESRYAALTDLTPETALTLARRAFRPERALLVVTGDFTRVSGFLVTRDARGFRITDE